MNATEKGLLTIMFLCTLGVGYGVGVAVNTWSFMKYDPPAVLAPSRTPTPVTVNYL